MAKKPKTRLGILFGGRSGEHEVSLASAASVIAALDPEDYEITAIGITKTGQLAGSVEVRNMLPPSTHGRIRPGSQLGTAGGHMRLTSSVTSEDPAEPAPPEIVFPLLHGPYGEDGTVQGLLEMAGLPYIGCGVLASAVGMDKDVMKRLFEQAGLPVVPAIVVTAREVAADFGAVRNLVRERLSYPVFSKPANLGSSVGVRKIRSDSELEEGVRYSAEFDRKVLIEQGVDAREIECAVLGNERPEVSVVGEVIPGHEFYDYDAKYVDPSSRLEIPARIPEAKSEEIRGYAHRAFKAIDGSGLARVDFFLDRRSGQVWVNEINTMPGFTPISMYSKLWAASGVPFPEIVRRLVSLGLERFAERNGQRVSHF